MPQDTLGFANASPDTQRLIQQAASAAGVNPFVLATVMQNESNYNLNAPDGKKGEIGPMQLMPESLKALNLTPEQARNPTINMYAGAMWLRRKIDAEGGNVARGVVAYNGSGPEAEAYGRTAMARLQTPQGDLSTLPPLTQQQLQAAIPSIAPKGGAGGSWAQPFHQRLAQDLATNLKANYQGLLGMPQWSRPQWLGGKPAPSTPGTATEIAQSARDAVQGISQFARHPSADVAANTMGSALGFNMDEINRRQRLGDVQGTYSQVTADTLPLILTALAGGVKGRFTPEIQENLATGRLSQAAEAEAATGPTTGQRLKKFPTQYAWQKIKKRIPGYDIGRAWQGTGPGKQAPVAARTAGAAPLPPPVLLPNIVDPSLGRISPEVQAWRQGLPLRGLPRTGAVPAAQSAEVLRSVGSRGVQGAELGGIRLPRPPTELEKAGGLGAPQVRVTPTHPPTIETSRRMVLSPEELQVRETRQAQLRRQASERGTEAAARGKAGAKLDYAQRQELARRGYSAQQMNRLTKAQIEKIFGGT